MKQCLTYLSKKLLIATLIATTSIFAHNQQPREVQLHSDEIAEIMQNKKTYVFIGEQASTILATMKNILSLADQHDDAPNLRALIAHTNNGYKTAPKEMVREALEQEAVALLEKHHAKIADEAHIKTLTAQIDEALDLITSDALTLQPLRSADDENVDRGCGKSKTLCNLTVTGAANVCSLHVSCDATIGRNLRVGGTLNVTGATTLANLLVTGNEVINGNLTVGGNVVIDGTLTVDGVVMSDAFVQGGNTFGVAGELGLNDANDLNIRTNSTTRMSISSTGAINVVAPTAIGDDALTVNANATDNALVVVGGAGAPAQTITAGANPTALDILNGNINLTNSTSASTGNITKSGVRFIHNFGNTNTFMGRNAGNFSILGVGNTGVGESTLSSLTAMSGSFNTACGARALENATIGNRNTAVGHEALRALTEGSRNTALGVLAGSTITLGSSNIIIGSNANVDLGNRTNCIVIGTGAITSAADHQIRIGFGTSVSTSCFIQGIFGIGGAGNPINITASGQLTDSTVSARRYKNNIENITIKSENVLALEPVSFTWKNSSDNEKDFGLIAEQVQDVLPEMVIYDNAGEIHGVQYKWLPVFLLSVIKEHQKTILDLQQTVEQLSNRIEILEQA